MARRLNIQRRENTSKNRAAATSPNIIASRAAGPSAGTAVEGVEVGPGAVGALVAVGEIEKVVVGVGVAGEPAVGVGVAEGEGVGVGVSAWSTVTDPFIAVPPGKLWTWQ